jgi:hypothetical protein
MNELNDADLVQSIIDAEASKKAIESDIKRLKQELLNRTEGTRAQLYDVKGEPFGDVSMEAFDKKIKFTTPKKVEWDQKILKQISEQIIADGGNVSDYMDIEYKVPESKWNAWGENIRAYFIDARTVSAGTVAVKIEEKK